jgi:hypothetical protein
MASKPEITPEQAVKLITLMDKGLRRPDFRHTTGFAFHTSWDRSTGRPRPASTKAECIDAVVGALLGKSVVPGHYLTAWLDRKLPDWRQNIGA